MHILFIVVSSIAGAAFWYYRLQSVGAAGAEVIGLAQRMRGKYKRNKLRKMAEISPFAAIDDPVVAAASLMISVCSGKNEANPTVVAAVQSSLGELTTTEHAYEAGVYGAWAHGQILNPQQALKHLCPMLRNRLRPSDTRQLMELIDELPVSVPPILMMKIKRDLTPVL